MLLVRADLGHRAPVADDDEDRVVAEAARATRRLGDLTANLALERLHPTIRSRERRDADEARTPGPDALEHREQPRVALLGRRVLAEETAAPKAGRTVERIDLEAGVVRDRAQSGRDRVGAGLVARVLRERRPVLFRLRGHGIEVLRDDEDSVEAGEEVAPLALLAGIARSDEEEVFAARG